MKYNPLILEVQIESIEIEDERLQHVWGGEISRVIFTTRNKNLNGNIHFDIAKN
jgi:hypothetical protein